MGTRETLIVMKGLAQLAKNSPEMQNFIPGFRGYGQKEQLEMLDGFVRRNYAYRPEILELIRTPQKMLTDLHERGRMEGDCDDISTFNTSVCYALGLRSRLVAIRTDPANPEFLHVFAECEAAVGSGNAYFRLDPTVSNDQDLVHYGERMEQNV